MTNPKGNEDINEELSTDELEGVSGGFHLPKMLFGDGVKSPQGSGSVKTLRDWENSTQGIVNPDDCPNFNPGGTGHTNYN